MEHSRPLAIDLFAGLGGWTEGLLAAGYSVVGFDIEVHDYGDGARYPAQLVLQDVMTLHGRQFKDAALIVASPPCQKFSYMAMPWSKAKAIEAEYKSGVRDVKQLTALFDACFRIQREACEAAGRHIPMVVENVRGAQKWVGRSAWNFGSFHLWGDVPALMPITTRHVKVSGMDWSKFAEPDYKAVSFTDEAGRRLREQSGEKLPGNNGPRKWADREVARLCDAGTKVANDWFGGYGGGFGWDCSPMRRNNSKSKARKAASAAIAKIPFVLAHHIAQVWKPREVAA